MAIFADTSAFYALLNVKDEFHKAAVNGWSELAARHEPLITSNYVVVETLALLGRRLGFQAVRDFQMAFVPVLTVVWVDEALHERAVAALLTTSARDLSVVDCVSFELIRRWALPAAFTCDAHFAQRGFQCIP